MTATDASSLSAAGHLADHFEVVPRLYSDSFFDAVLDVAKRHDVDVLIPTIDPEIAVYALHRERSPRQELTCGHRHQKRLGSVSTSGCSLLWLMKNDFPTVMTYQASDARWTEIAGPVVAKPRSGSSSIGIAFHPSVEGLPNHLAQRLHHPRSGHRRGGDRGLRRQGRAPARGRTETAARDARRRSVEGGHCSHPGGRTDHAGVGGAASRNVWGWKRATVFRRQFAVHEGHRNQPAVRGGYPLSHAAGADFITGMLEPRRDVDLRPLTWEAGVTMLRYDAGVFVRDTPDGSP